MLSMRWADINLERREWRIADTKNGEAQTVVLSPEVISLLSERNRSSEFTFPGTGKHGHLVEPRKGWTRILRRAGIENLRIHDLRRTLGSWQAKAGASLVVIGKSLGHKCISTTAIYARLDIDPVRESVERAASAIMACDAKRQA